MARKYGRLVEIQRRSLGLYNALQLWQYLGMIIGTILALYGVCTGQWVFVLAGMFIALMASD